MCPMKHRLLTDLFGLGAAIIVAGLASMVVAWDWEVLGAGLLVGLFLWPAMVLDRLGVYLGMRRSHVCLLYAGAALLVSLVFAVSAVPTFVSAEPAAMDVACFLLSVYAIAAVVMFFYLHRSGQSVQPLR
jgi:hypothetical protein